MRTADEIKGKLATYLLEGSMSIGLGDVMAAKITLAEAEADTRKAIAAQLINAIFKVSPLLREEGRFVQDEAGVFQQAVVYKHTVFVLNPAEVESFIEWLQDGTKGDCHGEATEVADKH